MNMRYIPGYDDLDEDYDRYIHEILDIIAAGEISEELELLDEILN